jgi:UDP-glucuronate 4-epimerase
VSKGLRFFSIYGEYGRPDQVFYKWIQGIAKGDEITLSVSKRNVMRSFTHVSDVVKYIRHDIDNMIALRSQDVVDVKSGKEVSLRSCIKLIEKYTGKQAKIKTQALQFFDPDAVHGVSNPLSGCVDIKDGLKDLCEHILKEKTK